MLKRSYANRQARAYLSGVPLRKFSRAYLRAILLMWYDHRDRVRY